MLIELSHDPETCPRLGRRCPAATRLAESFARAIGAARAVAGPGFALDVALRLDGCPHGCARGCAVRAEATATGVRVTCGSGARIERRSMTPRTLTKLS